MSRSLMLWDAWFGLSSVVLDGWSNLLGAWGFRFGPIAGRDQLRGESGQQPITRVVLRSRRVASTLRPDLVSLGSSVMGDRNEFRAANSVFTRTPPLAGFLRSGLLFSCHKYGSSPSYSLCGRTGIHVDDSKQGVRRDKGPTRVSPFP